MDRRVDSFRFVDFVTRRLIQSWIAREPQRRIPWTPPTKPLSECTVALVSTAGIATKADVPFDQEGERQNPWWGDPSFRTIPREATESDVDVHHLHIDTSYAARDLNCLFPLARLLSLARCGQIGRSAPSHYSFMGYILQPRHLLERSVPEMIHGLRRDAVDVVLLVPV